MDWLGNGEILGTATLWDEGVFIMVNRSRKLGIVRSQMQIRLLGTP